MIKEILLVHHSHTDIGYTHPQPVVLELHQRFIDQALDFADQTADWDELSRFKWTCEVAAITLEWWQDASKEQRNRFIKAVQRGQFEVAGFAWNMTPLMDHQMMLDLLKPATVFRSLGIPVTAAMNSDVNGLPWGMVDALLDHGITGLSMAINEHFGYAPQPRPQGFRWESPSGQSLLVYNGLHYGSAPEIILHVPHDLEKARSAIPAYAKQLKQRGHKQSFIMMQVTNSNLYDNAGPVLKLSSFVKAWNEEEHAIKLRIATLSEVFTALQEEPIEHVPGFRGDWTDWWNFGCGSTAAETSMALEGQRALREAEQLRAWPGASFTRDKPLFERSSAALSLYAEHTWGADRSIWKHHSPETKIQLGLKLAKAYEGLSIARMLRRDGLERLAHLAGGEDLSALFYNPLPFPVSRVLAIPKIASSIAATGLPQLHMPHRLDVVKADIDLEGWTHSWMPQLDKQWVALELPALAYKTFSIDDLPEPQGEVFMARYSIGNSRLKVEFDPQGGICSFELDGLEYAKTHIWRFGQLVLERPEGGSRQEMFGPTIWEEPESIHNHWHPDWKAHREGAQLIESRVERQKGCVQYLEKLEFSTGDKATVFYRVFPHEANLDIEVRLEKVPLASPHSLYLVLGLELEKNARCHFETAGAIAELRKEQLPNTSQHYLTTQRFIRLQDDSKGVTVACPDAPLWQVGGFTFGRHQAGEVECSDTGLAAWLTNNYWDTNFQADQSGTLGFSFRVIPHLAQDLASSVQAALAYAVPPQLHLYSQRGVAKIPGAQLFAIDLQGAILTGMVHDNDCVKLFLLNPENSPLTFHISPGVLLPQNAWHINLASQEQERLSCPNGSITTTLAARAWQGIKIQYSLAN